MLYLPLLIQNVELNPCGIAFLKVPDSFYNSKFLTIKIIDYEKEIGYYYC